MLVFCQERMEGGRYHGGRRFGACNDEGSAAGDYFVVTHATTFIDTTEKLYKLLSFSSVGVCQSNLTYERKSFDSVLFCR